MTEWTEEIKKRLTACEGPYHVGHISEASGDCMDVETQDGQIVAENTVGKFARFIVHAPTDIANLLEEREVLREALRLALHTPMPPIDEEGLDQCKRVAQKGFDALSWGPKK